MGLLPGSSARGAGPGSAGLWGSPFLSCCLVFKDICALCCSYGRDLGLFAPETPSGKGGLPVASAAREGLPGGWGGGGALPGRGAEVSRSSLEGDPMPSGRPLGAGPGPQ